MEIRREDQTSALVFRLSGRLTFRDSDAFHAAIGEMRNTAKPWVRLDLGGLEYVDSFGIGLIVMARDAVQESGGALELFDARGPVAQILDHMTFEVLRSGADSAETLRMSPAAVMGDDVRLALAGSFRLKDQDAFLPIALQAVSAAPKRVVLDLGELRFIDSIGVSLVMTAADEARKLGKELALAAPQGAVRELLRLTAIDSVLTVMETF